MDAGVAAIVGGVAGAMVGGPMAYFVERFFNRPRIKVSYAQTCYEDIISLPFEAVLPVARYGPFCEFAESQVRWHFMGRLHGNMFTREELRIAHELGKHFLDHQKDALGRFTRDMADAQKAPPFDPRLIAELSGEYLRIFESPLGLNATKNPHSTKDQVLFLLGNAHQQMTIASGWLDTFLKEAEKHLGAKCGSSDRIVVRVGIGNQGLQDGVILSEARLSVGSKSFRLPVRHATRPWESEEGNSPSEYLTLKSRGFQVVDFVVDTNMNATNDVTDLRTALKSGTTAEFTAMDVSKKPAATYKFQGSLPRD